MLIRGQTTEQRIAQIADAFKQGIDGYSAGQRRFNEASDKINQRDTVLAAKTKELEAEAQRRQEALERDIQKEKNQQEQKATSDAMAYSNDVFNKTGKIIDPAKIRPLILNNDLAGIGDILKSAPTQPVTQTRGFQEKAALAQIKGEATAAAETRKQQNQINKKITEASIADFEIADPSIIPTSKDAEVVKKLNQSNKSFQQIGAGAMEKLKKADPRNPAYYLSNDYKLLQQDLTKMKLQAKNLEELGVLNGPDLSLVNETLGSVNPSTLAMLGPEKAAQRLKAALEASNNVLNNAAAARNYKPKATPKSTEEAELAELAALRAKAGS